VGYRLPKIVSWLEADYFQASPLADQQHLAEEP
jgi:hypothetical protein